MGAVKRVWLFLSALALSSQGTNTPFGDLPEGWVYIDGSGIDTFRATLHDSVSGACVNMDAAWPQIMSPVAASGAEVGLSNGVRYHLIRRPAEDCTDGEALSVSFFLQRQTNSPSCTILTPVSVHPRSARERPRC